MTRDMLDRMQSEERMKRWWSVVHPKARGRPQFDLRGFLADQKLVEVTRGPIQYIAGNDLGVDDRFAKLFLTYWFANILARETGTSEFVLSITGQQVVTTAGDEPDTAYIVETGVGTLVFAEDHYAKALILYSQDQEAFNAIVTLVTLMA